MDWSAGPGPAGDACASVFVMTCVGVVALLIDMHSCLKRGKERDKRLDYNSGRGQQVSDQQAAYNVSC